jgi:hypothetical protein
MRPELSRRAVTADAFERFEIVAHRADQDTRILRRVEANLTT